MAVKGRSFSRGGGQVTRGALLLCYEVLLLVIIALCADEMILSTLKVRSFNVCAVVKKIMAVFSVLANSLSSTVDQFVACRLNAKGRMGLGGVFSSTIAVRVMLNLVIAVLTRIVNL